MHPSPHTLFMPAGPPPGRDVRRIVHRVSSHTFFTPAGPNGENCRIMRPSHPPLFSHLQGYGLTETCAASFIASPDIMTHAATVGPPTPCTEFRLESVPDMNYDALDPDEPKGEVLIRCGVCFRCGVGARHELRRARPRGVRGGGAHQVWG